MPQAPHCTRDPDARVPTQFDAGVDAGLGVTLLPLVISGGGAVLRAPTLVSVTFPADPHADELDDFVAAAGCTPYWHAIANDYGVGDAVADPPVRLADPAHATVNDTDIRA